MGCDKNKLSHKYVTGCVSIKTYYYSYYCVYKKAGLNVENIIFVTTDELLARIFCMNHKDCTYRKEAGQYEKLDDIRR